MSQVDEREAYEILRTLSSPLVALTCRRGDELAGMVANSAVRASIVPGRFRVANYVFKMRYTHRVLTETGRYVLHLLSRDQWDEVWSLGFRSGHDVDDKFRGLSYRLTETWHLPMLEDCCAWMRCRVVNVMDAGSSTFFMGEIEEMGRGSGDRLMDSGYFRTHMPEEWREPYLENLETAQEQAQEWEGGMDDGPWQRLQERAAEGPSG